MNANFIFDNYTYNSGQITERRKPRLRHFRSTFQNMATTILAESINYFKNLRFCNKFSNNLFVNGFICTQTAGCEFRP